VRHSKDHLRSIRDTLHSGIVHEWGRRSNQFGRNPWFPERFCQVVEVDYDHMVIYQDLMW
jgi:hypothetical protein